MKRYYQSILIIGKKKFIEQTIKALNLIKRKSNKDFKKIIKYLKRIKSAKYSEMILDKAQFNVGNLTAFHSVEWYASTIIHDAHHYYLDKVVKFVWKYGNVTKHEKLCTKEQIRFLKKIKAPKDPVGYLKKELKLKNIRGQKIFINKCSCRDSNPGLSLFPP